MAKLAVLVVLVYAIYFSSIKIARAQDELEDIEDDPEERSGSVSARARVRVSVGQGPNNNMYPQPSPYPQPSSYPPSSLSTLQPGSSTLLPNVECYVCTDCPVILPNTTTKYCPKTWDGTKDRSCVAYSEKYNHMRRSWYIRGCAAERGNCQEIQQAHSGHSDIVKLVTCHECVGDKCNTNGAKQSVSDITVAFIALIVTPLLTKYTIT